VGQSAGLTVIGVVSEEEDMRIFGDKVGRPSSSKLGTNQNGRMRLVAMTLALPVWAYAKVLSRIEHNSIVSGVGLRSRINRGYWCFHIRSSKEVMPKVVHWYRSGKT